MCVEIHGGRWHFNPRSPHGERHEENNKEYEGLIFQSTLPARGATAYHIRSNTNILISIHAPRTGSDLPLFGGFSNRFCISIHAPRTGSDVSAIAIISA